jgi:hypothetical protein
MVMADVVIATLHVGDHGIVNVASGFVSAGDTGVLGVAAEAMASAVLEACDVGSWGSMIGYRGRGSSMRC